MVAMDKPTAEIMAIGNELLLGQVQDSNAHWLAKKIVGMGGQVRRLVVVGDEPQAIIQEIHGALAWNPALIITTGGLGPTADDLTLAAVASATARPLTLHPQALKMVEERYSYLAAQGFVSDPSLTPARKKMAYLPQGADPLANSVGTAPGCLLRLDPTILVSLPGVPGEMMAIWEESLLPVLKVIFGENVFQEKTVTLHTRDESSLAPLLQELAAENPQVYIKSRARVFGKEVKIRVTVSSSGPQPEVEAQIQKALAALRQALGPLGIDLEEEPTSASD